MARHGVGWGVWRFASGRRQSPLLEKSRSERRAAAAYYVRESLMPGQRKSIEPIAARLGVDSQRNVDFSAPKPAGLA
jgi:hypothetical protein